MRDAILREFSLDNWPALEYQERVGRRSTDLMNNLHKHIDHPN